MKKSLLVSIAVLSSLTLASCGETLSSQSGALSQQSQKAPTQGTSNTQGNSSSSAMSSGSETDSISEGTSSSEKTESSQGQTSSGETSSTGSSSVDNGPVTNYSQTGALTGYLNTGMIGGMMLAGLPQTISFATPLTIDYSSQNGHLGQGSNANLKIGLNPAQGLAYSPVEADAFTGALTPKSYTSDEMVLNNYKTLNFAYGLFDAIGNSTLLAGFVPGGIPAIELPANYRTVAPFYKTATKDSEGTQFDLTYLQGMTAAFTDTVPGTGKNGNPDQLRSYAETGFSLGNPTGPLSLVKTLMAAVSNGSIDLNKLDVVGLLNAFIEDQTKDSLTDPNTAKIIGQLADLVAGGLSVSKKSYTSYGLSYIDLGLSLNAYGLSKATQLLTSLGGSALAGVTSMFSGTQLISQLDFTVTLYRDADSLTQFGGFSFDLNSGLGISAHVGASIDPEKTRLPDDYFDDQLDAVKAYRKTYADFKTFYDKAFDAVNLTAVDHNERFIKLVPDDKLDAVTKEDPKTGEDVIVHRYHDADGIKALAKEYKGLSKDVKFMLGDAFADGLEGGNLVDAGSAAIGTLTADGVVTDPNAFDPTQNDPANAVKTNLAVISRYPNYLKAIEADNADGKAVVKAINKALTDYVAPFKKANADALAISALDPKGDWKKNIASYNAIALALANVKAGYPYTTKAGGSFTLLDKSYFDGADSENDYDDLVGQDAAALQTKLEGAFVSVAQSLLDHLKATEAEIQKAPGYADGTIDPKLAQTYLGYIDDVFGNPIAETEIGGLGTAKPAKTAFEVLFSDYLTVDPSDSTRYVWDESSAEASDVYAATIGKFKYFDDSGSKWVNEFSDDTVSKDWLGVVNADLNGLKAKLDDAGFKDDWAATDKALYENRLRAIQGAFVFDLLTEDGTHPIAASYESFVNVANWLADNGNDNGESK